MTRSLTVDHVVQEVDSAVMASLRATLDPMVALIKDATEKYDIMEEILAGLPKHRALVREHATTLSRLEQLESNISVTVREVDTGSNAEAPVELSELGAITLHAWLAAQIANSGSNEETLAYSAVSDFLRGDASPGTFIAGDIASQDGRASAQSDQRDGSLSCDLTDEMPYDDDPEVPCDDQPEVPCDDQPEIPCNDQPEISCDDQPEISCDDEPEMSCDDEPGLSCDDEPEMSCDEDEEPLAHGDMDRGSSLALKQEQQHGSLDASRLAAHAAAAASYAAQEAAVDAVVEAATAAQNAAEQGGGDGECVSGSEHASDGEEAVDGMVPYLDLVDEDENILEAYLDEETSEVFEVVGDDYVRIGRVIDGEFHDEDSE